MFPLGQVMEVNVFVMAERSRDDELNRTVQAETRPDFFSPLINRPWSWKTTAELS